MSEEIDRNNGEVYKHYLELSKPTKEDFERVFTEEELKELCLKHKCSVDMYRWNVANDYRILFTESGRFQRWPERTRLKMLAKAVNKMKPSVLYDDEEIKKTRKEEWGIQLKENILSLNFWHRKQSKSHRLEVQESGDIDREVQTQYEVNTESMNSSESLARMENGPTIYRTLSEEVYIEIGVNTESMDVSELMTQSQRQQIELVQENTDYVKTEEAPESTPTRIDAATSTEPTQNEEENILVDGEVEYSFEENSNDSVETVLLKNPIEFVLPSQETALEIQNIYAVNTNSMSIDSEMSTQDVLIPQSEDAIPQDYDQFIDIIPLTSTQSQSQERGDTEIVP